MEVELRLFASLGRYLPEGTAGNSCSMKVNPGSTIQDLLRQLSVPPELPKIIFLNGVHAQGSEILQEGDRVGVFPPVAGG